MFWQLANRLPEHFAWISVLDARADEP